MKEMVFASPLVFGLAPKPSLENRNYKLNHKYYKMKHCNCQFL